MGDATRQPRNTVMDSLNLIGFGFCPATGGPHRWVDDKGNKCSAIIKSSHVVCKDCGKDRGDDEEPDDPGTLILQGEF